MKLVDLDQTIFVPVVDETHGGVTVEMQMTVGEFFGKFCDGFEPEVVEAIPVEWILNKVGDEETYTLKYRHAWGQLVGLWVKEQEGWHEAMDCGSAGVGAGADAGRVRHGEG